MDCSLPGSSVHGILQARILGWVALPFSGDLLDPGIELGFPVLQKDSLSSEPSGKPRNPVSLSSGNWNIGKDVEKRELLSIVGGTVNWCSHSRKKLWRFLKKLKIELPHDPGIRFGYVYIQRKWKHKFEKIHVPDTHSSIRAKMWKQSECPSTD